MGFGIEQSTFASKSSGKRECRHFSPEGFSEQIWILFEGDDIGEELFMEIEKELYNSIFENNTSDPSDRFENTLKEINEHLRKEAVLPDDFLRKNSFFIGLFEGKHFHFTTLGESEVYFVRNEKTIIVSEGISPENPEEDLFINIVSGEILDNDVFIFSTKRLLRFVSLGQLSEIAKNNPSGAVETIRDFVPQNEGGVFSVVAFDGAPVLPFESHRTKNAHHASNSGSFLTLISPLQKYFQKISDRFIRNPKNEFLFVGISAVTLLVLWTIFSYFSGNSGIDKEQFNEEFIQMEQKLGTAEQQIADDRIEEANTLLNEVETSALEIRDKGVFMSDIQKILDRINTIRDEASKTQRIGGSIQQTDISRKKENVSLKGVYKLEGEWYAYDDTSLFRILPSGIDVIQIVKDDTLISGIPFNSFKKSIFLSNSGKIVEFLPSDFSFAKTKDESSWKNSVDIKTYDKNLYLLSPNDNQIWKYTREQDSFSSAIPYNEDANLQNAISFAIDGSIFVLNNNDEVIKFSMGKKQEFSLIAAPPEFQNLSKVFTLQDFDLLIFLSGEQKRIFIFKKGRDTGATFHSQILLENAGVLTGIWADTNSNQLYVSDDKKVYQIPLIQN
jgi:hypothetical protein